MRLALSMLLALALCAIGLVTSEHKGRRLYTQLEQEKSREQQLQTEFGQLQLEQSTWAMHSRVEKLAADRLRMRVPDTLRTQAVPEPRK